MKKLKPSAHGRFLSFKDEDFCFRCFKDRNLACAVPKDEDFCISKTAFEIKHVESRRPSLKNKNLRLLVPHTGDFYVLERPNRKTSFLKDKDLPCAVGLRLNYVDSLAEGKTL